MFSQQPDQKNLLAAIVLSMGVLLLWQYFYAAPKLKDEQEKQKRLQQTTSQQVGAPGAPATPGGVAVPSAPGAAQPGVPGATVPAVPVTPLTRDDALKASPRVQIESSALSGSIRRFRW